MAAWRRSEHAQRMIRELRAHGVKNYRVEMGGSHPKLVFEWGGREIKAIFPGSCSDHRGAMNAVSHLRRAMGVQRKAPNRA